MADDFDFSDGDEEGHAAPRGKSLVDELFGRSTTRRPVSAPQKSGMDDSLPSGASTPKRKPTVTFQDPLSITTSKPSDISSSAMGAPQQTAAPQRPKCTSIAAPPSANLIETLFAAGPTGPVGRKEGVALALGGVQDQSPPAAVGLHRRQATGAQLAETATISAQQLAAKDHEIDQLRKELSTLRHEKADDQRVINELHQRLENTMEEHQRAVEKLIQAHRTELESLRSFHAREIGDAARIADKGDELLGAIKRNEGYLDAFRTRFDAVTQSLVSIRDELHSIGSREEDIDKVLALAEEKFSQLCSQLDADRRESVQQREEAGKRMESELATLSQRYTDEIIEGRKWLEEETRRLQAQRLAFQEEQSLILDAIDTKKSELDTLKQRFLSSEHDLLLRVVNERTLLDQQRRQFERQRANDVARLRAEAENLERYVLQVDQTQRALSASKRDYEAKLLELRDLKQLLVAYEKEIYAETKSRVDKR